MKESNNYIPDGVSPEATSGLAPKLRRAFLRSLIGSLVLAGAMGIYAFLLGRWGETEARILLTTLSLSFCSVTALASAAAFARGRGFPLAYGTSIAGVTVSIATFLLLMGAIWLDADNEPYVKTVAIAGILSFSLGQACLLGLVRLPRHLLWVFWLTLCAIAALAAVASGMIVFEADEEIFFRILGILGILDGCGTLTMPILARLHGASGKEQMGLEMGNEISLACPQCDGHGRYPLGDIVCVKCGLKLRVSVM